MTIIAVQSTERTDPELSRGIFCDTLYTTVGEFLCYHHAMYLVLVKLLLGCLFLTGCQKYSQ